MRGQAHIAYRDVQASTQAMRALQGFDFFGKEMVRHSLPLGADADISGCIEDTICERQVGYDSEAGRHISNACSGW